MSIPNWIDTSSAESNFVIANTPNFIVRKFKEDSAAQSLSKSLTGQELLEGFRSAVTIKPENLRQLVTPYLFLAAMYLKQAIPQLRDAAAYPVLPSYKWMATFRQILEDTFRPTGITNFKMPTINAPTATSSSYPSAISMFKVDGQ
jgi:hypothetical protein